MIIQATSTQVKQLLVNAINASSPVGMGVLQYKHKEYTFDDLPRGRFEEVGADYFDGRMVKLSFISKYEKGIIGRLLTRIPNTAQKWSVFGANPHPEYQSWYHEYPTFKELVDSVPGVVILEKGGYVE